MALLNHASGHVASANLLPELPPLPEAVTSFGAAVHQGSLYVFGGHKGERHQYYLGSASGSLHRLQLVAGSTWERLPDHLPAQGTALVAHGTGLYRVGGMSARNAKDQKSDLHSQATTARFNIATGTWDEFVSLPEPRSSHDATVIGDTLYVVGGWALAGVSGNATWCESVLSLRLNDSNPRWEALPQPFRRRAVAVAGVGDLLYCLGGIDHEGETPLDIEVLDTRTGAWAKGPSLPAGPMNGFGGSAFAHEGALYFNGLKGELLRLHPLEDRWQTVGAFRQGRFFHRLLPLGARQWVAVGGEGGDGGDGKRQDLEILNISTD